MIKNINVNEVIFSNLLVKEPVDAVNEHITGNDRCGKFILTGSRGCGKSTVLARRENKSLNTSNPAILIRFDGAGIFGTRNGKHFNKQIMEHYYEVLMCKKVLNYVKQYYPEVFYSSMGKIDSIMGDKVSEIDDYINNALYKDMTIEHKLFSGEMLSEILSLFRQGVGAESLTLMIDRFDWTHNSDPRVQEILSNYFSMFEKVIVTSDDPAVSSSVKKRIDLLDKGFCIVTIDYASDLETVAQIVEKRFEYDEDAQLPVGDLYNRDYLSLIESCDGNIDTILETFMYAETLHQWDRKKDIHTLVDEAAKQKVKDVKQYRKMVKPPKLHL